MIALLHRFHCKETESIDEALALVVEKLKLAKAKKKTGRLKGIRLALDFFLLFFVINVHDGRVRNSFLPSIKSECVMVE